MSVIGVGECDQPSGLFRFLPVLGDFLFRLIKRSLTSDDHAGKPTKKDEMFPTKGDTLTMDIWGP